MSSFHDQLMKPPNDEEDFMLVMELSLSSLLPMTMKAIIKLDGNVFRVYGLASVGRYLLPNEDGVSLAPIFLLSQEDVNVDPWYHLKDCLLEGTLPFMKAHNAKNPFEYAMKAARRRNLFNQSMHNHAALVMKKILEIYKGFEEINQLVDVAGGLGANISLLVSKYPQIRGIYQLVYLFKSFVDFKNFLHN
ncbi:hypothetical protein WN943_023399 [Citrus x changshan-huyou]